MKIIKIIEIFLITFCAFLSVKEAPVYGSGRNGCSPSKEYELKDDKSEPIKFSSSGNSESSKNSSSKGSLSTSSSSSNSSSKNK